MVPTLFVESNRKVEESAAYSHPRYPTQESAILTHFFAPPRTPSSPMARKQRKPRLSG